MHMHQLCEYESICFIGLGRSALPTAAWGFFGGFLCVCACVCEGLEKPPAISDAREGTVSRLRTSDLSAAPRPAGPFPPPPPSAKRDF